MKLDTDNFSKQKNNSENVNSKPKIDVSVSLRLYTQGEEI